MSYGQVGQGVALYFQFVPGDAARECHRLKLMPLRQSMLASASFTISPTW
jgi:hypothetical protein